MQKSNNCRKYYIAQIKIETKLIFVRTRNCSKKKFKQFLMEKYGVLKENIIAKSIPRDLFSMESCTYISVR